MELSVELDIMTLINKYMFENILIMRPKKLNRTLKVFKSGNFKYILTLLICWGGMLELAATGWQKLIVHISSKFLFNGIM